MLDLDKNWREFYVQGWGPDYSDTIVTCPYLGCSWEHTWADRTTLGAIMDEVKDHRKGAHRG